MGLIDDLFKKHTETLTATDFQQEYLSKYPDAPTDKVTPPHNHTVQYATCTCPKCGVKWTGHIYVKNQSHTPAWINVYCKNCSNYMQMPINPVEADEKVLTINKPELPEGWAHFATSWSGVVTPTFNINGVDKKPTPCEPKFDHEKLGATNAQIVKERFGSEQ